MVLGFFHGIIFYDFLFADLLKKLGYECSITSDDVLSSDEGKKKDKKQPSDGKPPRKKVDDESIDCEDEEDICESFFFIYFFLLKFFFSVCLEINGRSVTAKEKLMHYAEWCNFEVSFFFY